MDKASHERLCDGAKIIKRAYDQYRANKSDAGLAKLENAWQKWHSLEIEWLNSEDSRVHRCPLESMDTNCIAFDFGALCMTCETQVTIEKARNNPFHKCNDHVLYNESCLFALDLVERHSCQMSISSPPYFKLRDYAHKGDGAQIGTEETPEEFIDKMVVVYRKVRRALAKNGVAYIVMGDTWENMSKLDIPGRLAHELVKDGWIFNDRIIWAKNAPPSSKERGFTNSYEEILFMAVSRDYYTDINPIKWDVSQDSLRGIIANQNKFTAPTFLGMEQWEQQREMSGMYPDARPKMKRNMGSQPKLGELNKKVPPNIWFVDPEQEQIRGKICEKCDTIVRQVSCPGCGAKNLPDIHHGAIFPEELLVMPILASSKPGDIILEPFSGTGTTLAVARKLGRRAIGCELSRAFAQASVERIDSVAIPLEEHPDDEDHLFGQTLPPLEPKDPDKRAREASEQLQQSLMDLGQRIYG